MAKDSLLLPLTWREKSLEIDEVIERMTSHITEERRERIRSVIEERTCNVAVVLEGIYDRGNISAMYRILHEGSDELVVPQPQSGRKRKRSSRRNPMRKRRQTTVEEKAGRRYCIPMINRGSQTWSWTPVIPIN